jgi:hypothetical protein
MTTDDAAELARLRERNGRQNVPMHVQAVYLGLHRLPREIARVPGSRQFREALGGLLANVGPALRPTRREIFAGVRWLEVRNLLPDWVRGLDRTSATDSPLAGQDEHADAEG